MSLPEDVYAPFVAFGQRCVDCVAQSLNVINELDELLEAGFRGLEVIRVEEMIDELNEIESDTDKQQRKLQNTLFDHEADMSPVNVMFTYKIFGSIGEIADCN
jgi:predicted phosphate transport protein (TIGR00153 family)